MKTKIFLQLLLTIQLTNCSSNFVTSTTKPKPKIKLLLQKRKYIFNNQEALFPIEKRIKGKNRSLCLCGVFKFIVNAHARIESGTLELKIVNNNLDTQKNILKECFTLEYDDRIIDTSTGIDSYMKDMTSLTLSIRLKFRIGNQSVVEKFQLELYNPNSDPMRPYERGTDQIKYGNLYQKHKEGNISNKIEQFELLNVEMYKFMSFEPKVNPPLLNTEELISPINANEDLNQPQDNSESEFNSSFEIFDNTTKVRDIEAEKRRMKTRAANIRKRKKIKKLKVDKRNAIKEKEEIKVEVTNKNPTNFNLNATEFTKTKKKESMPLDPLTSKTTQYYVDLLLCDELKAYRKHYIESNKHISEVVSNPKQLEDKEENTEINKTIQITNNSNLEYDNNIDKAVNNALDGNSDIVRDTDSLTTIQSTPIVSNSKEISKKKKFVSKLSQVITRDPDEKSTDSIITEEENDDEIKQEGDNSLTYKKDKDTINLINNHNKDLNKNKDNAELIIDKNKDDGIENGIKNYMKISREAEGGLKPNLSEGNKTRLNYKVDSNNMEFRELNDKNETIKIKEEIKCEDKDVKDEDKQKDTENNSWHVTLFVLGGVSLLFGSGIIILRFYHSKNNT